jgi:hypothetical protein
VNNQETMNTLKQMLTMVFSAITVLMPGLATAQQMSTLATAIMTAVPALITAGSVIWSIYAHWGMKKVPDAATAIILPSAIPGVSPPAPAPVGSTVNLAPLTGVAKVVGAIALCILAGSLLAAVPASAQITKPKLPFDPLHLNRPSSGAPGDASSSTNPEIACDFRIFIGLTPANLEGAIKQCVSDVNGTIADDAARALDSAQTYGDNDGINCLKPGLAILQAGIIVPAVPAVLAVPAQPEIPANPNATPPTPDIPAVAAVAAVPAVPAKTPGLILLFQKYREFILSGGLTSCQTWINTPVNATIAQGINNVSGIAGAAAGAAILIPKP